ncbi:MAG TPA: thioredoxin-like domain-containing protein, partial [Polyangiaceae bacterium]
MDVAVRAPEFDPDLEWLETGRPPTMRELRGQVVVLDFWTYCCINGMHVVPVLRRIEERFAREPVVVLGVHSAKFDAEQDPGHVRQAIARYGIEHPVLVDRGMRTWSSYAVRSWPTLVVVRPDGTIAAVAPGEPDEEALAGLIEAELGRARSKGTLAKTRYLAHAVPKGPDGPLAYPGKVAVGPEGTIAIADSAHHRVLVVDAEGRVLHAIGSGLAGVREGMFARGEQRETAGTDREAALDDPQGMAWRGDHELFIADARGHVVVRADLAAGRVETVAGTGELGGEPLGREGDARTTALRSPWDVCFAPGVSGLLYVALAGSHQIAAIDLAARRITRVAGTGAESIVDGSFEEATFSQPSGLALRNGVLFVADSETSSVRALDLPEKTVRTVVGRGLFDFGDRDGAREVALLQHCVGIATDGASALVVADTYNGKLRRVDAQTGAVRTIASGMSEPSGLAWDAAKGTWLVADTNAHRVVRVHGEDAARIEPLIITGAPAPARGRIPVADRS